MERFLLSLVGVMGNCMHNQMTHTILILMLLDAVTYMELQKR